MAIVWEGLTIGNCLGYQDNSVILRRISSQVWTWKLLGVLQTDEMESMCGMCVNVCLGFPLQIVFSEPDSRRDSRHVLSGRHTISATGHNLLWDHRHSGTQPENTHTHTVNQAEKWPLAMDQLLKRRIWSAVNWWPLFCLLTSCTSALIVDMLLILLSVALWH